MVGALADWFAVTALFRHPLGLPIPHTAIIPKRKDQIGRSLGEFVAGQLPDPRGARRAARRRPRRPPPRRSGSPSRSTPSGPSGVAGDAMKGVIEVLDDRDVQSALGGIVERRLRQVDVAPLLGQGRSTSSVEGGHHQRLLDAVLDGRVARSSTRTAPRCAAGCSRSRRGGCPSRSTTASSTRSSAACSASSPTSAPTPTTRCAGRSRSASCASPTGCATTR